MIHALKVTGPPPVKPPPDPPPGGGNPQGCELIDKFPATTIGAAPTTKTYTFTNTLFEDITIKSVTLEKSTTGHWKVDASKLVGLLKRGETRSFTVTYTPPAK